MKKIEEYRKWILALVFAIIVIVVYKTFDNMSKIAEAAETALDALSPIIIGFVIAYIFNLPCSRIEAGLRKSKHAFLRKRCKGISITIVYLLATFLLYIGVRSIVPALYKNIVDLYYNIPKYFDEAVSAIVDWQDKNSITIFQLDAVNATNALSRMLSSIDIAEFSKYAQGVVKLTSGLMSIMIGAVASIYMLIEKDRIIRICKRLCRLIFKEKTADKIVETSSKINKIFSKYIFCLLLDATLMAISATIVLSLLGVKYAIILGTIIGICNLIPYFGAIISCTLVVVITLITGGPMQALWTGIALLVLQQVDGNFVSPKIMGEVLNISPLWIIFAVTLGGGLFGIGGMIVSVPIFMAGRMIISEIFNQLEARKEAKNANEQNSE